ncbi:MAG TPA: cytidine deaminase [Acidobacteriota bacterium]|nr:cytidine deaminase [Acidobacteriota bacterium]
MENSELIARAAEAREKAYAPYSGFKVGAALLTADGSVFTGGNVENASYGMTVCAERVAVLTAVAAGKREIVKLAVVTGNSPPLAPCGACRQVLVEFAPGAEVLAASTKGEVRTWTAAELLPDRPILLRLPACGIDAE